MPRARDSQFDTTIYELHAQEGLGFEKITERIEEQCKAEGRADQAPSSRLVARRLAEFKARETAFQRQFAFFRFPASLERDLTHPEAAFAAFELWRFLGRRPAVRLVRAFWLVTLAVSHDVPADLRYPLAVRLMDAGDDAERIEAVEAAILNGQFSPTSVRVSGSMTLDQALDWDEDAHGKADPAERQTRLDEQRHLLDEMQQQLQDLKRGGGK